MGPKKRRAEELVIDPNHSVPSSLSKHFKYLGSANDGATTVYQCLHCNEEKRGKRRETSNYIRHLKVREY